MNAEDQVSDRREGGKHRLRESLTPARWTPARFVLATFTASGVWFAVWKLIDLYAI
jgi:hypothetical protein